MRAADLGGVLRVQLACYGAGFVESAEVYGRRIASGAQCSLVAVDGEGAVLAYLAAYRSRLHAITPLDGDFGVIEAPDTLYLHDMAVGSAHAGQGLAGALLRAAWAAAAAWQPRYSALVAVQGAQAYWARHGYELCQQLPSEQLRRLRSYGADAVYMVQACQP
ncbi:N-acetyltransferase [Comamonas humi]